MAFSVNSAHIPSLFWAYTWSSQELKLIQSLWKCPDLKYNECEEKGFEPCPMTSHQPVLSQQQPTLLSNLPLFFSLSAHFWFSFCLPWNQCKFRFYFSFTENTLVSVNVSQIFLSEQEGNLFLKYLWIFKIPEHIVKKAKQEGNFFIPAFNKNINLQYSPLVTITHFFLFLYLRYLSVRSLILMSKYKLFK